MDYSLIVPCYDLVHANILLRVHFVEMSYIPIKRWFTAKMLTYGSHKTSGKLCET